MIQGIRSDRVPEELWREVHDIVHEAVIKTIPEKKCKKAKWLSEEALQIAEKREAITCIVTSYILHTVFIFWITCSQQGHYIKYPYIIYFALSVKMISGSFDFVRIAMSIFLYNL